jgi:hypothetical protein
MSSRPGRTLRASTSGVVECSLRIWLMIAAPFLGLILSYLLSMHLVTDLCKSGAPAQFNCIPCPVNGRCHATGPDVDCNPGYFQFGQICAHPGSLYHTKNNTKEAINGYLVLQGIIYRFVTQARKNVTASDIVAYLRSHSDHETVQGLDETDIKNIWTFNHRFWIDYQRTFVPRPPKPLPRFWTISGVLLTFFIVLLVLFCP